MYQNFYTSRPGLGYDLEVSPRIKGEKLSGLKGGLQIGMRLKPTDAAATLLQPWLISFSTTLAILETSLGKTTVPDLPAGTVDSSMVNTKFVQSAVAALIAQVKGNPPAALDTFAKFAQAIGNDPQYLTNTLAKIAAKANLSEVVNRAVGVGEFTGTAPNYTVTLANSALTAPVNGMVLRIKANAANTGALTLTTNMSGDTAKPILLGNGQALRAGDIVGDGFWATLQYSSAHSAWLLINPANALNQKFATLADLNANTNAGFVSPSVLKDYLTLKLGSVSGALTTLQALYDALGGDANFAANLLVTLATKAPKDNPVLTGTPTGVTVDVATNNTREATTAFVTAAIAAAAASIVIAEATTTVAGKVLIASSNKFDLGEDTSSFVTPAQAKQAFSTLMPASSSEFTDVVYGVTRPLGTLDSSWATSRFLENALYAKFDQATDTLVGASRVGQVSEYNTGTVDTYVTPLALKTKLDQIPLAPDASTTTVGKVRLANSVTDTGGVLTPALLKAAVDLKIAQAATGFAAPSVGVPASSYAGSVLSIDLNASPGGTATSITQFKVTISAADGSWTTPEAVVAATNNSATYNFTPTNAQSGLTQVSVIAVDNLNANSPSQVETLTIYVITVNTPQFTYPLSGNTGVSQTAMLTSSDFGLSQGAGTHTKSDWKITSSASGSEVIVQSSLDDAVNLKSYQLDTGVIGSLTTYKAYVRYYDATYGWSEWGSVSFTTDAGSAPVLAQTLSSPGAKLYGYYGWSTSLSEDGTICVVGAPGEKKAYIYEKDAITGAYALTSTLIPDSTDAANMTSGATSQYSECVKISKDGTTVAVGAPCRTPNSTSNTAYIYIYRKVSGVWTKIYKLSKVDSTLASAWFGGFINLSYNGDILYTTNGMYGNNGITSIFGYKRSTGTTYTSMTGLPSTAATSGYPHFDSNLTTVGVRTVGTGFSISFCSTTASGTPFTSVLTASSKINAETSSMSNTYSLTNAAMSSDGKRYYSSSSSAFDFNATTDLTHANQGGVTLWENATAGWTKITDIQPTYDATRLFFGQSIAMNDTGSLVAISSGSRSTVTNTSGTFKDYNGRVHIYAVSGNTHALNQVVSSPNGNTSNDQFGDTVCLDKNGNTMIVSAYKATDTYTNEGKVYLYKL